MRRWLFFTLFWPMLLALFAPSAQAIELYQVCEAETATQERLQAIPDRLLHAISLVESGRWDAERRESFAWPWTVMAEGEGHFLPTKEAAVALVKKLQAKGVKNIDVGCMQVNLQAHKGAFRDLDEAFEPASNVAYAARFLTGLYSSTNNWATAGAYYHSQTPALASEYKAKLLTTWNADKSRGGNRSVRLAAGENRPPLGMGLTVASVPPAPAAGGDSVAKRVAAIGAEAHERTAAERNEAAHIANAYRQARLEEYRLRRQQAVAKG